MLNILRIFFYGLYRNIQSVLSDNYLPLILRGQRNLIKVFHNDDSTADRHGKITIWQYEFHCDEKKTWIRTISID